MSKALGRTDQPYAGARQRLDVGTWSAAGIPKTRGHHTDQEVGLSNGEKSIDFPQKKT